MIYKIWRDADRIFCVDTTSMDVAFEEVRVVEPDACAGQACDDNETKILNRIFSNLSLGDVRIIPDHFLKGNMVVDSTSYTSHN